MAPKKTAKASNSQAKPDITHSDATGMDASQSQDIDTKSLQDLLSKHKQQVCKHLVYFQFSLLALFKSTSSACSHHGTQHDESNLPRWAHVLTTLTHHR